MNRTDALPLTHIRCMDCDTVVVRDDARWVNRRSTVDAVCAPCAVKFATRKAARAARRDPKPDGVSCLCSTAPIFNGRCLDCDGIPHPRHNRPTLH
jgi:hypothetical protein